MATNNAISLGQFTKGITNIKNYVDNNMNSNNIYNEYKELVDFTFNVEKDGTINDNQFDIIIDNYNANSAIKGYFKVIELDEEYDFINKLNKLKYSVIPTNDSYCGLASDEETNPPYSILVSKYATDYSSMIAIYYGKKVTYNSGDTKETIEENNKYITISFRININQALFDNDVDLTNTIQVQFSFSEYNSNTLLQFPFYKQYNNSIIPLGLDITSHRVGEHSISHSDTSDIPSYSYISGNDNVFPSSYASSNLSVFGVNNTINMTCNSLIAGAGNEIVPHYTGPGLYSIILAGNLNKIHEAKENKYKGLAVIGQNLNVSGNGLYVGAYGTVPYSEIFALCQGTSSEDKVLFSVNRNTGAVTSISTPTEDNHLTTKKYVDDANIEATDKEIDAMLLEVLGGDYSVQS